MHVTSLEISGFKSLNGVSIPLQPFTVLVGANGSGKSNVLEALRILQGLALGFTVRETFDGVSRPGRQWDGVRGGWTGARSRLPDEETPEELSITAEFSLGEHRDWVSGSYGIRIRSNHDFDVEHPVVEAEHFQLRPEDDPKNIRVERQLSPVQEPDAFIFSDEWNIQNIGPTEPFVSQTGLDAEELARASLLSNGVDILEPRAGTKRRHEMESNKTLERLKGVIDALENWTDLLDDFRVFRLIPDHLREPASPSLKELDEQGRGLGPVVRRLVRDEDDRRRLIEWLSELLPLQVTDLDVVERSKEAYQVEIVEALDEEGEQLRRSADVLSDGTLHFLGLLAALFGAGGGNGTPTSRLMAFEDIEDNLHPSRLHTLIELFDRMTSEERTTEDGVDLQVLATTHAPHALDWFDRDDLDRVLYTWRDAETMETKVRAVSTFQHLDRILENGIPLSELHTEDWFAGEVE